MNVYGVVCVSMGCVCVCVNVCGVVCVGMVCMCVNVYGVVCVGMVCVCVFSLLWFLSVSEHCSGTLSALSQRGFS